MKKLIASLIILMLMVTSCSLVFAEPGTDDETDTTPGTETGTGNDENEEERYIHKERYVGNCSRSFYVGENVKQEDVKASFKNGTLILTFPKKDGKKLEEKKYIAIDD